MNHSDRNLKSYKKKIEWGKLRYDFKPVIYMLIIVFIPGLIIFLFSSCIKSLGKFINRVLPASSATPWGVITSLFVYNDVGQFISNTIAIIGCTFIFTVINYSDKNRRRNSFFLLFTAFFISILSNLLWIRLHPDKPSVGSSGIGYTILGVDMGFALFNITYYIFQWITQYKTVERKKFIDFILNSIVFYCFTIFSFYKPRMFFSIFPGVNVFVHVISFLIGFTVTISCLIYNVPEFSNHNVTFTK